MDRRLSQLGRRLPDGDLGKNLGYGLGVAETGATAAADTADKVEECRNLRRQMRITLRQVLRRDEAIPDAQAEAAQTARDLQSRARQVAAAMPSEADGVVDTEAGWRAIQGG